MASSAVTPSRAAPYPVLVGTATTGAGVIPPTRLARAPSMPATTTTASASASSSAEASSRCTPATPQSASSVGRSPRAVRVASHSRATGQVRGPGGDHQRAGRPRRGRSPHHRRQLAPDLIGPGGLTGDRPDAAGCSAITSSTWPSSARVRMTGPTPTRCRGPRGLAAQQLAHDGRALLGRLALPVDGLGQALPQVTVVVDLGESEVGEGKPPQPVHGLVGRARPRAHVGEQALQCGFVHDVHYPAWVWPRTHPRAPIRRGRRASGSSGPRAPSPRRPSSREPDYADRPTSSRSDSLAEVLESVRQRPGRPRLRPPGERHRGHGPGHHRQPGLRLRPAHPAGGGPRRPPPSDGPAGNGARRHRAGGLDPGGHRPVPPLPAPSGSPRPRCWPPTPPPRPPACSARATRR